MFPEKFSSTLKSLQIFSPLVSRSLSPTGLQASKFTKKVFKSSLSSDSPKRSSSLCCLRSRGPLVPRAFNLWSSPKRSSSLRVFELKSRCSGLHKFAPDKLQWRSRWIVVFEMRCLRAFYCLFIWDPKSINFLIRRLGLSPLLPHVGFGYFYPCIYLKSNFSPPHLS